MLILLPVILLSVTSAIILILRFSIVKFKYSWIIAFGGSVLGVISIFLWRLRFPSEVSLLPWQSIATLNYSPAWIADISSWSYALALSVLALSTILVDVINKDQDPFTWIGILLLVSLSILCVSSGNPLTLILSWALIDLAELGILLWRQGRGSNLRKIMQTYVVRVIGMGVILTAIILATVDRTPITFEKIAQYSGPLVILGVGLRLGLFPLQRPYPEGKMGRHGLGTILSITTAVSSLAFLPRISSLSISIGFLPVVLVLVSIPALYAGWRWMRASDEFMGQPFWVLGVSSCSIASTILGSAQGSIGWGLVLILLGGLISSYSARNKKTLSILLFATIGLFSLPFTVTAKSWISNFDIPWYLWILWIPAQSFLIAGYVRHALHTGEINLESQFGWVKVLYTLGLSILVVFIVFFGIMAWFRDQQLGSWWTSIPVVMISAALSFVNIRYLKNSSRNVSHWGEIIPTSWLYRTQNTISKIMENIARSITSTLEGEGGVFWSFLLLVLILSLLSAGTP